MEMLVIMIIRDDAYTFLQDINSLFVSCRK